MDVLRMEAKVMVSTRFDGSVTASLKRELWNSNQWYMFSDWRRIRIQQRNNNDWSVNSDLHS